MKRLVMAVALVGVLFISALAGDMSTVDSHTPGPGATPQGASAPGDIPTGEVAQLEVDDVLSALLSVLGLVV